MKKCMIWGFTHENGAAIISELKKYLDIIFWVSNTQDSVDIFTYIGGRKLDYAPDMTSVSGYHDFYKENFLQYQIMATRRGLFQSDIHKLGNEFAINYYHFSRLLSDKKPDIIIFANLPHEGSDYILYKLAKSFGIKTILCYQTIFSGRFLLTTKLEDFGFFETIPTLFENNLIEVEHNFKQNLFYMDSVNNKNGIEKYRECMGCIKKIISFISETSVRHKLSRAKKLLFSDYNEIRQRNYIKSTREKYQKKLPIEIENAELVYVPLHLQPELSTATLGGVWQDQPYLVETLRTLINESWFILVKENPKQTYFQRDNGFFDRISNVQNTIILDRNVPTLELLNQSKLVATVSGTAGWESVKGGGKCLMFGQAWYATLAGVLKYQNNLSCSRLNDFISEKISFESFLKSFRELEKKMAFGVTDSLYGKIVRDFSLEKNAELVVGSLLKVIESRFTIWE